jgi:hypothetical protein
MWTSTTTRQQRSRTVTRYLTDLTAQSARDRAALAEVLRDGAAAQVAARGGWCRATCRRGGALPTGDRLLARCPANGALAWIGMGFGRRSAR